MFLIVYTNFLRLPLNNDYAIGNILIFDEKLTRFFLKHCNNLSNAVTKRHK